MCCTGQKEYCIVDLFNVSLVSFLSLKFFILMILVMSIGKLNYGTPFHFSSVDEYRQLYLVRKELDFLDGRSKE